MLAYYLLLGIPLLLELITSFNASNALNAITEEKKIKSEKKIIVAFFFIFFLLLAFRSTNIGIDLSNYEYYFNLFRRNSWSYLFNYGGDIGYFVLNKIVGIIGGNFQFFLVVVALICVLPFAYFYYKESENAMLTISIFVNVSIFTMFFSGLRQTIAFSIGIIAFYYVKKKKKLTFLLWVFVAYMFHSSAFVLLILYPIYHAKITKKSFKFIVPLMVLLFIFKTPIFNFLVRFLGEKFDGIKAAPENAGAYTIFILFILFTIYSFVGFEDENIDKNTIGLRNILVVATCLQMFAAINSLAMRMNYYFISFIPVIISKISASGGGVDEKNITKTINVVLIAFFLFYFFYSAKTGEDILEIFPYETFWSE